MRYVAPLKVLTLRYIPDKIKKNIRSPLLQEAYEEIIPAIKLQRGFRRMPRQEINRNPELMTESTMRRQIHHHFKNDYEKFVNLLYNHLEIEFDSMIYNVGYPIQHQYRGLKYIIDNINEQFFIILGNIDPQCELDKGYDKFIMDMKDALHIYPENRNALNISGQKPKEQTNEQFALKNILSNLKGNLLKNLYEVFLEDKYDNFGADVATANEDPRYEGVSIFKKSSRASEKEKAKKTMKNNKTMKKYIREIKNKTKIKSGGSKKKKNINLKKN